MGRAGASSQRLDSRGQIVRGRKASSERSTAHVPEVPAAAEPTALRSVCYSAQGPSSLRGGLPAPAPSPSHSRSSSASSQSCRHKGSSPSFVPGCGAVTFCRHLCGLGEALVASSASGSLFFQCCVRAEGTRTVTGVFVCGSVAFGQMSLSSFI